MTGAYETPSCPCPYCGSDCEADWCDVGVGNVQCGPYHCENCHAVEVGAHDDLTGRDEMVDSTLLRPGIQVACLSDPSQARHDPWPL